MGLTVRRTAKAARRRGLIGLDEELLAAEVGDLTQLIRYDEQEPLFGNQTMALGYTADKLVVVGTSYEAAADLISVWAVEDLGGGGVALSVVGAETMIWLRWQRYRYSSAAELVAGIGAQRELRRQHADESAKALIADLGARFQRASHQLRDVPSTTPPRAPSTRARGSSTSRPPAKRRG